MKIAAIQPRASRLADFIRVWGLALMVLIIAFFVTGWSIQQLLNPQILPIKVVGVDGEVRHLDRSQLEEAVYKAIDGSFFSVDLAKIRTELERLPWVDTATIRRVWPDRLQVSGGAAAIGALGKRRSAESAGRDFPPPAARLFC